MPMAAYAEAHPGSTDNAAQWSTAALSPGSSRSSLSPPPVRYTVFDIAYHFRVLECEADDTEAEMLAKALSLSPSLQRAVGFRLTQIVQGLPTPQFVLHTSAPSNCVVPVQHSVVPVLVCTIEAPLGSTAFQVAYRASEACASLRTAHYQIARRTATMFVGQIQLEPHASNCVLGHSAVLLQGHTQSFRPTLRYRSIQSSSGTPQPQAVVYRPLDPDDVHPEGTEAAVSLLRARSTHTDVSFPRTLSMPQVTSAIAAEVKIDAMLHWPIAKPALPDIHPIALVVEPKQQTEAERWIILDIRRLAPPPPLLPLQVVPAPATLTAQILAEIVRGEFPAIARVTAAYCNVHLLTSEQISVNSGDVFTLLGEAGDAFVHPALDSNTELMCSLPGLQADLLQYLEPTASWACWPPPAQVSIYGFSPVGTSESSVADTDASASHYGDLPHDEDMPLDMHEPSTNSTVGHLAGDQEDVFSRLLRLSRSELLEADTVTTTTTTAGATSATTTPTHSFSGPITLAFATPGDKPRSLRLLHGGHVGHALWQILSDPTRELQDFSAWTLATCPRTFPEIHGGRLILTTLSTCDPFYKHVWLDLRTDHPKLFSMALAVGQTSSQILARFFPGRTDLLLLLDGALAGDIPAIRDGCVLTICRWLFECDTQPLSECYTVCPTLRLLQFAFKIPRCVLALRDARIEASTGTSPVAYSCFHREFLFRLDADASARLANTGHAAHQALLAICSPAFGVCRTTAGFSVAPTARQLWQYVRTTWPELVHDRISDAGEVFEEASYFFVTPVDTPLTALPGFLPPAVTKTFTGFQSLCAQNMAYRARGTRTSMSGGIKATGAYLPLGPDRAPALPRSLLLPERCRP